MRFDRLITIQTLSRSEVYPGDYETSWTDGATIRARVQEETGREAIRAGQVDAEQAVVVTTRYKASDHVTVNDRFIYDGDVLNIRSAREVGRKVHREFLCVKITTGAEA